MRLECVPGTPKSADGFKTQDGEVSPVDNANALLLPIPPYGHIQGSALCHLIGKPLDPEPKLEDTTIHTVRK